MENQEKISFSQTEIDFILELLGRHIDILDIQRVMINIMMIMRDQKKYSESQQGINTTK